MKKKHSGGYMLRLKVREIAESKKINQAQLSRSSDVPINTIRRIWRNPYYEVRLSTLNKIAAALGVPATDLFEETENRS
jgi:transcriptional regulator with XRE-family HTH domain